MFFPWFSYGYQHVIAIQLIPRHASHSEQAGQLRKELEDLRSEAMQVERLEWVKQTMSSVI